MSLILLHPIHEIKNFKLAPNDILVSFFDVSLFTNVPVNEACKIAERKLRAYSKFKEQTDLDADEIIKLLELCLSTTYF